ncbi:hypothetical protein Q8F55_006621 [Vanrija albida]|uniref:Amino acid transporter transmembrane domain-containing protein n=1 Tax=Vanrija albida TaxID=181172 RepID=A0ABR3PXM8_9TREE
MASNLVPPAEVMLHDVPEPEVHLHHSPEVDVHDKTRNSHPLEVYLHYAAIERAREEHDPRPIPDAPWTVLFKTLTGQRSKIVHPHTPAAQPQYVEAGFPSEKKGQAAGTVQVGAPEAFDAEIAGQKETAYRLLRVASWQIVFYLITTDILGFSSAPMAFAELGYGPGVLVYTFFFLLAFGSGQILWRMYLGLDSEVYPVTCYADLGERTFGPAARHVFNVLQSLQLIMNVAILIIGNGQTLATIINYKFCYIVLNVFWALAGMVAGQIKSLRNFAWFTNLNIWLNLVVMAITMAGIAIYAPVPSQSNHKDLSQPIMRSGWVPSYTVGWFEQVGGVQLAVFSYGGAMIFTEFMAEMRRPRDFWKAAFFSQLFCYVMYMFFGLFCYSYQGQYTAMLPSLNFDNTKLQLACNIIGLVSTGVAAVLYANIGVKVFYQNVLREYLSAPALTTRRGAILWSITVVIYWCIAWVVGSAIPNLNSLVTIVGAACILQFTYTFPPLLLVGFWVQHDAMRDDAPWEPGMEEWAGRVDSWREWSRWKRGFAPYWWAKGFLLLLFLGALALAGLGLYAGIEGAIQAFAASHTTSFSCRAPGQP